MKGTKRTFRDKGEFRVNGPAPSAVSRVTIWGNYAGELAEGRKEEKEHKEGGRLGLAYCRERAKPDSTICILHRHCPSGLLLLSIEAGTRTGSRQKKCIQMYIIVKYKMVLTHTWWVFKFDQKPILHVKKARLHVMPPVPVLNCEERSWWHRFRDACQTILIPAEILMKQFLSK